MGHESFEAKLIRQLNAYIRQLKEQIDVYREKDEKQELLIEDLNRMLDIFAEEISRLKAEKEEAGQTEAKPYE